jgi:hypothetical protein
MATKKKSRTEKRPAKKQAKAKKSTNDQPIKKRIPRQTPLPGIGDEKIAAIENAALDYAEIRDQRQALTSQEVELKGKLLDLMHAKKLTEYKRNGISVKLVAEQETVKVRVKSEEELTDDTPADPGEAPAPNVSEESMAVHAGE